MDGRIHQCPIQHKRSFRTNLNDETEFTKGLKIKMFAIYVLILSKSNYIVFY